MRQCSISNSFGYVLPNLFYFYLIYHYVVVMQALNLPFVSPKVKSVKMELTITRPDDWHLHLRDGNLLEAVAPHRLILYLHFFIFIQDGLHLDSYFFFMSCSNFVLYFLWRDYRSSFLTIILIIIDTVHYTLEEQ